MNKWCQANERYAKHEKRNLLVDDDRSGLFCALPFLVQTMMMIMMIMMTTMLMMIHILVHFKFYYKFSVYKNECWHSVCMLLQQTWFKFVVKYSVLLQPRRVIFWFFFSNAKRKMRWHFSSLRRHGIPFTDCYSCCFRCRCRLLQTARVGNSKIYWSKHF